MMTFSFCCRAIVNGFETNICFPNTLTVSFLYGTIYKIYEYVTSKYLNDRNVT